MLKLWSSNVVIFSNFWIDVYPFPQNTGLYMGSPADVKRLSTDVLSSELCFCQLALGIGSCREREESLYSSPSRGLRRRNKGKTFNELFQAPPPPPTKKLIAGKLFHLSINTFLISYGISTNLHILLPAYEVPSLVCDQVPPSLSPRSAPARQRSERQERRGSLPLPTTEKQQ